MEKILPKSVPPTERRERNNVVVDINIMMRSWILVISNQPTTSLKCIEQTTIAFRNIYVVLYLVGRIRKKENKM